MSVSWLNPLSWPIEPWVLLGVELTDTPEGPVWQLR